MYYTIYKTTNLINGKFYIGKHQTKVLNDDYMGSGKLIRRAFKKYGIENFAFEYLGIFDQEWQMNLAEKIYVVLDKEMSYNLCPGGQGGFGYINKNGMNTYNNNDYSGMGKLGAEATWSKFEKDTEAYDAWRKKNSESKKLNNKRAFLGRKHSDKTKALMSIKISEKSRGENNSQFGTCWVMNDIESKKIKKEDLEIWLLKGYRKGRKVNNVWKSFH